MHERGTPRRILATTNAAVGHFLPMAPTLAALVAGGHDVRVGCPERFVTFVERCGFTAVGCQEVPAHADVPPVPPAEDRAGRLRWAVVHSWPADCRSWVDQLLSATGVWQPDLVMVEPVEHAGRLVASVLCCPLAVHGWGFTLPAGTDELAARGLSDLYHRVGARPSRPSLIADLGPERVQAADIAQAVRFGYVPWRSGGDPLPPRSGTPRALLTLGTYPNPKAAVVLRAAARAALAAGVEVVVVLGNADRGEADDDLSGAVTVAWTDMRAAIASSDVVIHHGGAGMSWTTLISGRPAVVLPQGGDQFANAARLAAVGAAVVLEDVAGVAAAVRRVLTDHALARNAMRIARENAAMRPPADLAAELVELANPAPGSGPRVTG